MRRLFGAYLAEDGFEVIYAHNGYEGWEFARKFSPSCILLDINLPDINGLDLAARLRNDESTKRIPVAILTSADLTQEAERELGEIGISQYIHKSITKDEFLDRVRLLVPSSNQGRH